MWGIIAHAHAKAGKATLIEIVFGASVLIKREERFEVRVGDRSAKRAAANGSEDGARAGSLILTGSRMAHK